MGSNNNILLAFYGDDFTGSTDALEFICRAGAKAILFIEPPTAGQLAQYPGINAYGVAGKTRSLPPQEMEEILLPAFEQMKANGARHIHYKVCSTFDSSPSIGSIGRAIDCGSKIFPNNTIPVLGGMPALGRYCVFGNLFAAMGTEGGKDVFRLDRHPSMSKHPVTPAGESDLRLHLGKQTGKSIGLIDILQLKKDIKDILADEEVVLVDALYEEQLTTIGEWLDTQASATATLFSVGSSGIEMALGKHWQKEGVLSPVRDWSPAGESLPLLIISGSCSPVTEKQITTATDAGFAEYIIDPVAISNDGNIERGIIETVIQLLQQHQRVIVHTGNNTAGNIPAAKLGSALGLIAKQAVEETTVKRVIIAGGDTSSYAARAMEIDAVEMIAPYGNGAPMCRAISANGKINGLEVNFKGGQVGAPDYFIAKRT